MSALSPGSIAPDFTLPGANEEHYSLSKAASKGPVLLVFFKVTCPICHYALPFIDRLRPQLVGQPVTIWAVSQDSPEQTARFNREFGIGLLELFDSEEEQYRVSNAYGLTNVPTTFLVEQDGTISHASVGWNKQEVEDISARLAQVTALPELTPFRPGEEVQLHRGG